jgi:4-alpha-glucanotransferase
MPLIAEDLGYLTEEVMALRAFSGYPGMKILQFAFDSREPSNYLPHCYDNNCICYTGTHDNATLQQWLDEVKEEDLAYAIEYLGLSEAEGYATGIIRGGMSSVSDLFVAQMQDWLGLGKEARMNEPGILGHGNWCWRMLPGAITDELTEKIGRMTKLYGRA